jgi:hypothetical protein
LLCEVRKRRCLDAVFTFDANEPRTGTGEGTGLGIGYRYDPASPRAYLSPDGSEWVAVREDYNVAVQAVLTRDVEGMGLLSRAGKGQSGIVVVQEAARRVDTTLSPPEPNPCNPTTRIAFSLRDAGLVELNVYTVRGALVRQLEHGVRSAGTHETVWAGVDEAGQTVASGTYLIRMATGGQIMTQRVTLVR